MDISDALSEKDKVTFSFFLILFVVKAIEYICIRSIAGQVKFTVHTKTSMPEFSKNEFSVIRLHEDFIWLHDDIRGDKTFGS